MGDLGKWFGLAKRVSVKIVGSKDGSLPVTSELVGRPPAKCVIRSRRDGRHERHRGRCRWGRASVVVSANNGENTWETDARICLDKMKLQKKKPTREATLFPPAATTTGRQRQRDSLKQCSEGRRKSQSDRIWTTRG